MGRWRPPPVASSPYITPGGATALQKELKHLWSRKRPRVVRALSDAAAEGDRSENAEYIYRKKQLGEIDRRIRYISKRLDVIQVVDRLPEDRSTVRFGAFVTLEDDVRDQVQYRIVGADETSATLNWISIDSPMARGLLGKKQGEQVKVDLPQGARRFRIVEVSFEQTSTGT